MIIQEKQILTSSLVILIFLFAGSCDNSFDPTDEAAGGYSVHGTLDLLEESSYIRVRDLNDPFTAEATEELEAVVTLQNLDSGVSTILDSNIREVEGVFLHTFQFDGGVVPDTPYRLRVENSEGIQTELETVTPTLPVPQIDRENDGCSTPTTITFQPMNGGTITLRFGTGPEEDDPWGRLIELRQLSGSDLVSTTFSPLIRAQGATLSFGVCSSLLRRGNLYVAIAHYSPGFYEKLNSEVTDILESTQQFGGFYADTLAIPVDTSL